MKKLTVTLELPDDIFDAGFREADFESKVRELAIVELLRSRRLHEHEAQRMLKLERWELVERMEAVGITPTEKAFGAIKDELDAAVARRKGEDSKKDD